LDDTIEESRVANNNEKIELLKEENFILKNELEIAKNQLKEAEEIISK